MESTDVEQVDRALQEIAQGNLDSAELLLQQVIANTPSEYRNVDTDSEGDSIRFWDQAAFIHFVTWSKENGLADRCINWIGNAYPRAHYYLGFIRVKQQRFDEAIEVLDRGLQLEPDNPKLTFEKAQALVRSGNAEQALRLYDSVSEVGPYVSVLDLAVARRGRGFVLIELNELDQAEAAFRASLELEPDNAVALNELQYIAHLRQGGSTAHTQAVATSSPGYGNCGVCGKDYNEGVVFLVRATPVPICSRCQRKLTKKWWQFWK